MRKNVPGFLLALALAATLSLSGCGGGDEESGADDTPSESTSESSSSEDTTQSESEPEAAPEAPDATPEEPEAAPEGDGEDGKPSREDVIAGYEKIITAQSTVELPGNIVTQTATCFVDELYDVASAETLQAIADENPEGIDPADASLFGDAGVTCAAG